MAPDGKNYDFERHYMLTLLGLGPQLIEEIKKAFLGSTEHSLSEARETTVAGRSRFDVRVRKMMSSLCNAGLAESVGGRRFGITEDGMEVYDKYINLISTEDLKKESPDYLRLVSGPDPVESAPALEKAPIPCKTGIVAMIDML